MIINYDSPGQLCNRIWSLLPSIAYGLQYKEKVLVINFSEYSDAFDDLNSNKLIKFASRKRLKRFFLSLKSRGYIQNGRPNIFSKFFHLNLIEGWSNRLGNAEMVVNQADEMRRIFSFRQDITNPVDRLFSSFRDFTVVGVHIRRGDYKEWLNGIYYYTDEEYARQMYHIQKQLESSGEKVKFLVCSNESVDLNNYKDLDCFMIPESSGVKDLYALSKCGYILGPPSSYSQWASFYGKVPVNYIMEADEKLTLSYYSAIISFNTFGNGKVLNIE
ncbi:MAG: alpha-1,2-fucosyltransferase [Prevotella sp.]|jgi:hypothetical protein|nr:alpha-1,2-fucosyltransferase [Prevotella sp.]